MPDRTYPFAEANAAVAVTNIGRDRTGRYTGIVAVQPLDGTGYLVAPRSIGLFETLAWDSLATEAAARDGLTASQWAELFGRVRIGLLNDIGNVQTSTPLRNGSQWPPCQRPSRSPTWRQTLYQMPFALRLWMWQSVPAFLRSLWRYPP
jgi:hypothetical protein